MVVDRPGLDQLVAAVAGEEYYAFDTEFHTERTYVPDLALIQIAWADKVALVDPLAVDPEPLAALFSGPGTAVAHAASQDLDVLQAACGTVPATVFDTQIVAGFLGMSTPSLSRLVDQVLGVTLPKADRLSDWLVRPISERQITYAVSDVAHLLELRYGPDRAPAGTRPARVGAQRVRRGAGRSHPGSRARGGLVEAGRHPQHVAPLPRRRPGGGGLARAHRGRDEPAAAHGALGPRAAGHLAAATAQRRQSSARTRGVDGRHLAQGRAAEILAAVERGLDAASRTRSACPPTAATRRRPPAAVAVCSGLVRQIADDLDFDQGLLATRADIAQLLCGEPSRLDEGWRRAIVGDPLRRLIAGEVAAGVRPAGPPRARGALAPAGAGRDPQNGRGSVLVDRRSRPAQ